MARRRNNCKPAKGVATGKMTKKVWETFDNLPRDLRVALWESPVPINPASVAEALQGAPVYSVARRIRESVQQELLLFAAEHQKRHGCVLPHVSANASVQRYEAAQPKASGGAAAAS